MRNCGNKEKARNPSCYCGNKEKARNSQVVFALNQKIKI